MPDSIKEREVSHFLTTHRTALRYLASISLTIALPCGAIFGSWVIDRYLVGKPWVWSAEEAMYLFIALVATLLVILVVTLMLFFTFGGTYIFFYKRRHVLPDVKTS